MQIPTLRIIWAANALLFFAVSGVLLATVAILADQRGLYLFGFDAQGSAGLLMAALMAARAGASLASGSYLDRTNLRTQLLLPAMAGIGLGFILLGEAHSTATAVAALVLIGLGSGGLTIPLVTLLGDMTPRHLHGRALSIYQWSSDFGGALGPAAGLVLAGHYGYTVTYALVGIAVFGMVWPLRRLIKREAANNRAG